MEILKISNSKILKKCKVFSAMLDTKANKRGVLRSIVALGFSPGKSLSLKEKLSSHLKSFFENIWSTFSPP